MNQAIDTNQQQIKESNALDDAIRNINQSWFWKTTDAQCSDALEKKARYLCDRQLSESRTVLDDDSFLDDELSSISSATFGYIEPTNNAALHDMTEIRESYLMKRENDIVRKEHELMQKEHQLMILEKQLHLCLHEVKQKELMTSIINAHQFKLVHKIKCHEENISRLELDATRKTKIMNDLKDKLSKDDPSHVKLGLDSSIGGWTLSHVPKRLNKKCINMIKPGISNIKPINKNRNRSRKIPQ